MAKLLLNRALIVVLNQVASVLGLGLKPFMEPSFGLLEQNLAELGVKPHGHSVEHDDHHAGGQR